MEKELDLRIQKTYKNLTDALLELLQEKDFEKITVNELCERAMVRRATFYKHFADKYEFFAFVMRGHLQEFNQKYDQSREHQCLSGVRLYEEMVQHMFSLLDFRADVIRFVIDSSAFPTLFRIIAEQAFLDVKDKFQADEANGLQLSAPPDLVSAMFIGAMLNSAIWWIKQPKREDKDVVVAQFCSMLETVAAGLQSKEN